MKNINKIYIKNFLVDVIVFFFRGLITIAVLVALYLAITKLMNYQIEILNQNQTTK
jgi:hypoxanthine phosphoribosyltransferase